MYAKSARTIANIIEAAEILFVAKNYNEVTMTDIARQADVTKGALYHHFPSKEALYLKMMHTYLEEIEQLMQETAVDSQGSARERLCRLTLSFLELSPRKQTLMRLVRRDINVFQTPEREAVVQAYQKALPEKAEMIILDGIRDQQIGAKDARLLAWQHVAMVEVILVDYARQQLGGAKETADFVIDLFFDGVGVREQT